MDRSSQLVIPTPDLARKLIAEQFPEYGHLSVSEVEKQGHDNRTYKLGSDMLIRMPTDKPYALKVHKEQELLPKLAPYLSVGIPMPIKMGVASRDYPYPFSIYKWLPGMSLNLLSLSSAKKEQLALDLAKFLKELEAIEDVDGLAPGQHNFWRGDHISVYDKAAKNQIEKLTDVINSKKALWLWEQACATQWNNEPVWVHGDFAIGNMLISDGKLSGVIDFGGTAVGDPACDLVIAWTYLSGKARTMFMHHINLDKDTWLRAKAWALWKATFELCQIDDKNSREGLVQRKLITEIIRGK